MPHRMARRIALVWGMSLTVLSLAADSGFAQQQDGGREHVLFQAIRRGDAALLAGILRRGTPPDVRGAEGTTPLMEAALHGSAEMVERLLEHGANSRAENNQRVTALLWGAADEKKVRLLLDAGADVNARSSLGNTPLMAAAASPDAVAAVKLLIEHGADVTLRNKSGRTPLAFAAMGGDAGTVRLLLAEARQRKKLDEVVRAAGASVAVAAGHGYEEIVKLLLENGADADRNNGSRGHGLNAALLAGNMGIARELIAHGTKLDRRIRPGDDPTAVLAAYNEVDDGSIVELLKQHGVDFAAENDKHETALTWARLRGHRRTIEALLAAGAPEGKLPDRPSIPSRKIDMSGDNGPRLIAAAVEKSVALLELGSDGFLDVRRNCVSCHHQNLPGVAMAWARDRGFRVRRATLERILDRQVKSWSPRIDRAYQLDSPFPVPPRFLGYGMWTFAELGYRPDELTRAAASYLAATQQRDGRWVPGMLRPPLGGETILATALAMRSLQLYPVEGRQIEMAKRVARARSWLERAEPRTHEERVFRMLGLAWAGAEPQTLADDVQTLLDAQRDDGGWAQLPELESDAWATGQSLVALHAAGGVPVTDPAYRRGVEMLLRTQFDDGSWYVQSRSWPFQPYFESKFPFGRDQWISAPATAWAVMALVPAIEPDDVARLRTERSGQTDASASAANTTKGSASGSKASKSKIPAGSSPEKLVPAAKREVDFVKDIQPLLVRSCLACHGDKEPESNFSVTSRAALLRGGDSELPAVVPGAGHQSPLLRFPAGLVENLQMPPLDAREKYPPLTSDELSLLRAWIDQGARWPADVKVSSEK